jgi:hypothetical protein
MRREDKPAVLNSFRQGFNKVAGDIQNLEL